MRRAAWTSAPSSLQALVLGDEASVNRSPDRHPHPCASGSLKQTYENVPPSGHVHPKLQVPAVDVIVVAREQTKVAASATGGCVARSLLLDVFDAAQPTAEDTATTHQNASKRFNCSIRSTAARNPPTRPESAKRQP